MRSIERLFVRYISHTFLCAERRRDERRRREDAFDDFGLALGMIGIVACGVSDALFVPLSVRHVSFPLTRGDFMELSIFLSIYAYKRIFLALYMWPGTRLPPFRRLYTKFEFISLKFIMWVIISYVQNVFVRFICVRFTVSASFEACTFRMNPM